MEPEPSVERELDVGQSSKSSRAASRGSRGHHSTSGGRTEQEPGVEPDVEHSRGNKQRC